MSSFAAGTPQHSTLWLVVRCSRRATRQRCGHRHAGAVRRTSVSLAFCCPRTCVRGQHLIVPPTNAANAAARMQSQTRTKNSTNPSHLSSKQTPHISHSPAYKNTNPSHFPPSPTLQPHTALAAVYIYIQTPQACFHSRPRPMQRCPYARIHHHHKPQLPCPHCIFVSTSARARSCTVFAALLLIPISVFHAPAFIQLLLAPASGEKSGAACAESVALDWLRCFEHAAG